MAIAPVQHASATGTTTANVTLSATGSTGNILHANVFWNSASKAVTMSDNGSGGGGVWTSLGSPQVGAGGLTAWRFQQFVCLAPKSGTTTVTATEGGGGGDAVHPNVHEWTGFVNTPTVDGSPVYAQRTNPSPTAGPISSTIPVAVLLCAFFPGNAVDAIISAPFTDQSGASGDATWGAGAYGYQVVSSTQSSVSATSHETGADDFITGIFVVGDVVSAVTVPNLFVVQSNLVW